MTRIKSLTSILLVASAALACEGDSGISPSDVDPSQVLSGTVSVPSLAIALKNNIQISTDGTLTAEVTWFNVLNDLDSGLWAGNCTGAEVAAQVPGCRYPLDALVLDESIRRTSEFSTPVTAGTYTLMIRNHGAFADNASYRLVIN